MYLMVCRFCEILIVGGGVDLLFVIGSKRVIICILKLVYDLWKMLVIGVGVGRVFRTSFEKIVIMCLLVVI